MLCFHFISLSLGSDDFIWPYIGPSLSICLPSFCILYFIDIVISSSMLVWCVKALSQMHTKELQQVQ